MSCSGQSQDFKSIRQRYISLLTTRSETLKASRAATRHTLHSEGLYNVCKYLFCAGDAAYVDDPYPKQQCGSFEFLCMVKEIKPCLSYEIMSEHSNNYIVSFMYCGTEFYAVVSREELKKEGMMKDGVPSQP
jgi:hypothetical protein